MVKNILFLLLVIIISALTAFSISKKDAAGPSADNLARVLESKTLRCGYVDYEPANFTDTTTGEKKGILFDVAESMGKQLGLKIEWVQSGGWATYAADLAADKFDIFCGAAWAILPVEMKELDATTPIYFSAVSAWTRHDDTRYDTDIQLANNAATTIAATDGNVSFMVAQEKFPNARLLTLPESTPYTMNLQNVLDNKADVTFVEQYVGYKFATLNDDKIKNVTPDKPVRISPNLFEVRKGNSGLLSMINMTLNVMHDNGEIDRIIKKYEPVPDTFLRRAPAYTQPATR